MITNPQSFQWCVLLLFLFLLLLFLLLFLLLGTQTLGGGRERAPPTLLDHQLAVVFIAGMVPRGLTRGEVEIVDVPRDILALEEEGRWKVGVTSASQERPERRDSP